LDVRARAINDEMKIAAAHALASLAREDVPDSVARAYGGLQFSFGRDYIIPKPFDPRVLLWVAPAVAKAALDTGVARRKDFDCTIYRDRLERLLGPANFLMRNIVNIAKSRTRRIVFPEADDLAVLRAAHQIVEEEIASLILLGNQERIEQQARRINFDLSPCSIVDPYHTACPECYVEELLALRQRKGMTRIEAQRLIRTDPMYLGALMVRMGEADGLVGGEVRSYADAIRPVLQVMGSRPDMGVVAGCFLMLFKNRVVFLADCAVNHDPTVEQVAKIAVMTADLAAFFGVKPRVALLAYSNFGSVRDNPISQKMGKATELTRRMRPDLEVEGEMQADTAVNFDLLQENWPFARLTREANVLIFPDLMSGNIAFKLLRELGGATAVGPLLMGINGAFNVLTRGSDPDNILNVTAVTVCQASGRSNLGVVKD
jgi:malate dehydrogenase (oxaloacetate-decarboxylating)(NADP+)